MKAVYQILNEDGDYIDAFSVEWDAQLERIHVGPAGPFERKPTVMICPPAQSQCD